MKTPEINLEELRRLKEKNFRERLEFIDQYAKSVKKTPNKQWSSQQKEILD